MSIEEKLPHLNSMTKYPSIPTFHEIGDKGRLNDVFLDVPDGDLVYTEKVDGTNARIVISPDDVTLIGSREDFLHALGDVVFNPAQHIVETIRDQAKDATEYFSGTHNLVVLFGEVYGTSIGKAAKNYTRSGDRGFRLFDAIEMPRTEMFEIMKMDRSAISTWRETQRMQPFVDEDRLQAIASELGWDLTPRLSMPSELSKVPDSVHDGLQWLRVMINQTHCNLDGNADMTPEGIVVRAKDRSFIAKIRYEDYERTARARKKAQTA
tara:strand:- start:10489 stop:11286 length:798 start_codon:yes stop_codon:yes gene_type:complete